MAKKFKLYKANKKDKCDKYIIKLQKHYNDTHGDEPWIICFPVIMYDGRYAVTLLKGIGEPANDGDDGNVDSIEPPVSQGE